MRQMYETARAFLSSRGFSDSQCSYILWGFEDVAAGLRLDNAARSAVLRELNSFVWLGVITWDHLAHLDAIAGARLMAQALHVTEDELRELCDDGRVKADGETLTRFVQALTREHAPRRKTVRPGRMSIGPRAPVEMIASQSEVGDLLATA